MNVRFSNTKSDLMMVVFFLSKTYKSIFFHCGVFQKLCYCQKCVIFFLHNLIQVYPSQFKSKNHCRVKLVACANRWTVIFSRQLTPKPWLRTVLFYFKSKEILFSCIKGICLVVIDHLKDCFPCLKYVYMLRLSVCRFTLLLLKCIKFNRLSLI